MKRISLLVFLSFCLRPGLAAESISALTRDTALYAAQSHTEDTVKLLRALVVFPTVHQEGMENKDAKPFKEMTAFLKKKSEKLGFDFFDGGAAVVIGLGRGTKRFGIVTHGDVQPADPSKWKKSPFVLDDTSEPKKLIGRGTEDDKGSIATALYALKAIKDKKLAMDRRVELIVSYTEESDWDPFKAFLKDHPPPDLNIVVDGAFPVVVAEKGWCSIHVTFPAAEIKPTTSPYIKSFSGGAFLTQVPEEASAIIVNSTPALRKKLETTSKRLSKVQFAFEERASNELIVRAKGVSAHSSEPESGINAISYLSELLGEHNWLNTSPSMAISYVHELVGIGIYGEKYGKIAYRDSFMGPMTLNVGTVKEEAGEVTVGINLRRPVGKDKDVFEKEIDQAIHAWKLRHPEATQAVVKKYIGDTHFQNDSPHVPILLSIFSYFSGEKDAKATSTGGSSHARLVPHGVQFGPSMPGAVYSGHSEHEFTTREQISFNLKTITAAIVELAGSKF